MPWVANKILLGTEEGTETLVKRRKNIATIKW